MLLPHDAVIVSELFGEAALLTLTHSLATQARSGFVMMMPIAGPEGRLVAGDAVFSFTPGRMFVLEPWQVFSVEVPKGAAVRLFLCRMRTDQPAHQNASAPNLFETARGLLAKLVLRRALPPKSLAMLVHSANCTKISRAVAGRNTVVTDFRIRRVVRHLHGQPDCPVDMLARLAGIGTQHFFDRFRACTGLTPRGYANVIKLELALDRVAHNDESLSDVSQALGFANQSHFTRFFRHRVGINPRAYRSGAAAGRRAAEQLCIAE